jgi:hypothetical protein
LYKGLGQSSNAHANHASAAELVEIDPEIDRVLGDALGQAC